ncbi:MAG: hypothetical protein H6Q60_570 [Oscillospiraceae bacterium]|nr:hypothetical protein [Oscillospiraceae bacterium]
MKKNLKTAAAGLMAVTILAAGAGASASAASVSVAVTGKQTTQASQCTSSTLESLSLTELETLVNSQSSSDTKTQALELLEDYETKNDAIDTAQDNLVTALEKYGITDYLTDGSLDTAKIQTAISSLKDTTGNTALTALFKKYSSAVEAGSEAKTAFFQAVENAGYSNQTAASQASQSVTVNLSKLSVTELESLINSQASSDTRKQILSLLADYKTKEAAVTTAEKALTTALEKYGVKDYETNGELDTAKVKSAISGLKDQSAASNLTALLTSYNKAVTARDTAKTALITAMEAAGYNKKTVTAA